MRDMASQQSKPRRPVVWKLDEISTWCFNGLKQQHTAAPGFPIVPKWAVR